MAGGFFSWWTNWWKRDADPKLPTNKLEIKTKPPSGLRSEPPANSHAAVAEKARSKGYAQAQAQIKHRAKSNSNAVFNLKNLKLTELPPEIGTLTKLGSLDLTGNSLTAQGIAPLASLRDLIWLSLTKNEIGPDGAKTLARHGGSQRQ